MNKQAANRFSIIHYQRSLNQDILFLFDPALFSLHMENENFKIGFRVALLFAKLSVLYAKGRSLYFNPNFFIKL